MMMGTKLKQEDDDDETNRFLSPRQQQQNQQQSSSKSSSMHSPSTSPRFRRSSSETSSASGTTTTTTMGPLPFAPFCRGGGGGGGETTSGTTTTTSTSPGALPSPRLFCCFGQIFLQILPDRVSRTLCPAQKRRLRNAVSAICCLVMFAMIHNTLDESMRIPNIITIGGSSSSTTTLVKRKDMNNNMMNDNDNDDAIASSVVETNDLQQTGAQAKEEQRLGEGTISIKPKEEPEPELELPAAYAHVDPPRASSKYSNASQHFVERWCELDNKNIDWFPQGDKLWQRRAPAFIIPGAKFAGTDLLVHYLQTMPPPYSNSIISPTFHHELSFFFDPRFQKYVTPHQQKTRVQQARERLYAKFFNVPVIQKNQHLITFDATSGYLFYSTLLPRRIFCVMPWIRLVVVLRHPTDRLYHHYIAAQRKGLRLSFEEWIDKDFQLLHDVGFFQLNNTTSTSSSSSSSFLPWSESIPINNMTLQDIAWFQYQQQSLEGAVGRSLYEVQLRQWFQALRAIGRKPSKSVLIVWTHDLIQNPQVEMKRVAQFLQLVVNVPPPLANKNSSASSSTLKTSTASALIAQINATTMTGMNSKTRQRLNDFFRPYNKRLRIILQAFDIPNSGGGGGGAGTGTGLSSASV